MNPFRHAALAAELAARDFLHERTLSLCAVLGLAAVLAPLLVLYGLKFGMISQMTDTLQRDPRAREIRPVGHGAYTAAFIDTLRRRPDVAFVVPATRFLAATLSLRSPEGGREPLTVEMWPTGAGDPMLGEAAGPLPGLRQIVLSRQAAEKLGVGAGGQVIGRIGRNVGGVDESATVTLSVAGVLPVERAERDAALVNLDLLLASEDYREGLAAPAFGWTGAPPGDPEERRFASFRLFATGIAMVEGLRDHLAQGGIDSLTRLSDIRMIQDLDRGLTALFLVISGLGVTGYAFSLYVNLWAMVERKKRDLAVLRLIGMSSFGLTLFPITNAALTASFGVGMASLIYLAAEPVLNDNLLAATRYSVAAATLRWEHFAIAALLTLCCAVAAAAAVAVRAARVEPAEGLRDE